MNSKSSMIENTTHKKTTRHRAGDGFGTERDREEGEYEPEDIRMDARCQERKRRRTEHTTS